MKTAMCQRLSLPSHSQQQRISLILQWQWKHLLKIKNWTDQHGQCFMTAETAVLVKCTLRNLFMSIQDHHPCGDPGYFFFFLYLFIQDQHCHVHPGYVCFWQFWTSIVMLTMENLNILIRFIISHPKPVRYHSDDGPASNMKKINK